MRPYLPPDKRITYSILRPATEAGHGEFWRAADCEESGCPAYRHGWTTVLHPVTQAAQAHYIRSESGRSFVEQRTVDGQLIFTFEPGQRCFRSDAHRVAVEREPLFVVRNGDSRAWTGGGRTHARAEDWRDDFGEHQQKLHDAAQEG